MRILLFFIWITLGLVYFMIWGQRSSCCDGHLEQSQGSRLGQIIPPPILKSERLNETVESIILEEEPGCVLFGWGKADPVLKPCFDLFKDSILQDLGPYKTLELGSEYFEAENKIMSSGDLGLVRASKLKELFGQNLDPSRIRTRSFAVSDSTGKLHKLFQTLRIRLVYINDQVKELDDKTLIYFKYASNEHLDNKLVEVFATDLAAKLKNTHDIVQLVGHTDDDATAEHNMTLGLRRANLIKALLVSRGISGSRIKTSSKGEEQPIAPNDTEENRKLNRRVELTIVPPAQSK